MLLPSTNGTWFPMDLFPEKDRGKLALHSHSKRSAPRLKKKELPAEEREKGKKGERKLEIKITEHLFHLRLFAHYTRFATHVALIRGTYVR